MSSHADETALRREERIKTTNAQILLAVRESLQESRADAMIDWGLSPELANLIEKTPIYELARLAQNTTLPLFAPRSGNASLWERLLSDKPMGAAAALLKSETRSLDMERLLAAG